MFGSAEGPIIWVRFLALVLVLLFADLYWFHRRPQVFRVREALWSVAFWVGLAVLFIGQRVRSPIARKGCRVRRF